MSDILYWYQTVNKNLVYIATSTVIMMTIIIKIMISESMIFATGADISCMAQFSKINSAGMIATEGIMHITFDKNNTGDALISASAKGLENDTVYRIERHIEFNYDIESKGYIRIFDFNMFKRPSDTVPDDVFSMRILDINAEQRKIQVHKLNNAILIGDFFSPVLMCVSDSDTDDKSIT